MVLAERIKRLRQEHNMTQGELAAKIGLHQKQISAYERGRNIPSTEVLIKLAEVFNVTLDYLAFESKGQPAKLNIQDRELLKRFEVLDGLSDHDKDFVKEVIDLIILKNRFKELAEASPV